MYFCTGLAQGYIRRKTFSAEFMSQFDDHHLNHFGSKAPIGGYPDDGNGYYSRKLSYKDWYVFNNWQRAHLNFLETYSVVVCMTFITAFNAPLWAAVVGYALVLGRIFYGLGYCNLGPKGRLVGALLWDLGLLAAFAGSIYSLV